MIMKSIKRVLFVCAGNTCRSPLAKVILEEKLKDEGMAEKYRLESAAYGEPGEKSAHPIARLVIKELYEKDLLKDHLPRKLTSQMVDKADLILVMEGYMKAGLPPEKVVVLDIPDPFESYWWEYGGEVGALIRCVEALKRKFCEMEW